MHPPYTKSLLLFSFSCRKRHSSETLSDSSGDYDDYYPGVGSANGSSADDDEQGRSQTPVMNECTAAMVLMNLSFSPQGRSGRLAAARNSNSGKQFTAASDSLAGLTIPGKTQTALFDSVAPKTSRFWKFSLATDLI